MSRMGLPGAVLVVCCARILAGEPASGPLRVHADNPRYFADGSGAVVYLTGSHVWSSIQDWGVSDPPPRLDYSAYLDLLERHDHNFARLWVWEQSRGAAWTRQDFFIEPLPYPRTGPGTALDGKPRFDLNQFNPAFFERLRERVKMAGKRGIYVGVMLFEGWSIESKGKGGQPYRGHPFHRLNNINGIDGDANGDEQGREVHTLSVPAITALQEAYVRKTIDTLNDLDNVIWEIGNECHRDSEAWQNHIISFIKRYEASKPNQHPIWMTVEWEPGNNAANNRDLTASAAEAISPNSYSRGQDYKNNPPAGDGRKVILVDTDHLWGIGGDRVWVWKSFLRGLNPIFMDPLYGIPGWEPAPRGDDPKWAGLRRALGCTRRWAGRVNLAKMVPQGENEEMPSSTRYCLFHKGREYLVYQPARGTFTVELPAGRYRFAWIDPGSGRETETGSIAVDTAGRSSFDPPADGDAVLYLAREAGAGSDASP